MFYPIIHISGALFIFQVTTKIERVGLTTVAKGSIWFLSSNIFRISSLLNNGLCQTVWPITSSIRKIFNL